MSIGAISIPVISSITEPTVFRLGAKTAADTASGSFGLCSAIQYPGGRGTLFVNGVDPMRHVMGTDVYRTGLLAPNPEDSSDLSATPTGARATATLDLDVTSSGGSTYNPANGDILYIGNCPIRFNTTLPTNPILLEILIGADGDETLDNLRDYFDNTSGTKGVTWDKPTYIPDIRQVVEVTAKSTYDMDFRVIAYGAAGNKYFAWLKTGNWTDCAFGTSNYFTGGTDGSGSNPAAGDYQYRFGYYRQADGAESGYGEVATASQEADQGISLAGMYDPVDDDDIDFKRWYRTLSSGVVYYHGRDILDSGSTDTDTISNTVISTHNSYDASIHRPWEAGHIHRCRFLVPYKGRWVGGGALRAATYTAGTADVEDGKNVVYISGGVPTKRWEHRTFRVNDGTLDDAAEYEIIAVDTSTDTLYLDRPFEGTTVTASSGGAAYEVIDKRDPFMLYFCEPLLPNQTSAAMEAGGVLGPDPEGITGLYPMFESVIIFTKTGIWRLTGSDPLTFRITHEYEGVGCVGGQSIVSADGLLYWLASDGVYAWTGTGEPYKVSSPPSGELGDVRGIQRTIDRINWAHASQALAHYDPEDRILRWFVPLDDDITNRHALVFDLDTKSWALDTCEDISCVRSVSGRDGSLHTLAGDIYGHLWELDVSTTDGAFGFAPVQTVQTGATTLSFSVSGTPLPTTGDGLSGVPVLLIDANGTITRCRVASNTSSTVTLSSYLSSAPTAGTYAVFGGIHQRIESGRFTYAAPTLRKSLEYVKVAFSPSTEGRYWLSWAVGQDDPAVVAAEGGDPTVQAPRGGDHHWIRRPGERLKIRLDQVTPGGGAAFQHLEVGIRVRD